MPYIVLYSTSYSVQSILYTAYVQSKLIGWFIGLCVWVEVNVNNKQLGQCRAYIHRVFQHKL